MEPVPKLSCGRCKRRKIRCDKRNPCSACENANTVCEFVQRARLPRGRTANSRKAVLEKRLARLENLMTQAQNPGDVLPATDATHLRPSSKLKSHFVAPDFWTALTEEVAGLRETLEDTDDEECRPWPPVRRDDDAPPDGRVILFGFSSSCVHGCAHRGKVKMSIETRNLLQRLYRQRVDCLYKIIHWPTVSADMERSRCKEQDSPHFTSIRALESSIYFMALCSLTDGESKQLGLGDRGGLIDQYRNATESAIAEADLFHNPNVTVLQALVIYLLGLRTCNNSAKSWTLLAVAVRVGTSLRLGQEDDRTFDPFELQIRRRLWYCIAGLDTFASLDRGTAAIVNWNDLGPPPLTLNDEDISPGLVPQASSLRFNEMSFLALMNRAMIFHKKMLSIPVNMEDSWTTKSQLVLIFERGMKEDYINNVKENAQLLERFAAQAANAMIAAAHLVLRRPPYKQSSQVVPPSDDFDVLGQSVKVLRHELDIKSSEFSQWAWKSWVQWYALAIVLAELCSRPPTKEFEAAYAIAVRSFHQYSSVIADNEKGMLWKPIAKLMRRVQRQREGVHLKSGDLDCVPLDTLDLNEMLTTDTWSNSMIANPWPSGIGEAPGSGTESMSRSRGDEAEAMCDDSQLNWSMFMDQVNLDYSFDMKDDLFWDASPYQQQHDSDNYI